MIEDIENNIKRMLDKRNYCLPAKVAKINEDGTLDVEVQIQYIYTDLKSYTEKYIDVPIYTNVRLFSNKGGDFVIYTPIKVGDSGILLAFDRDCKLHFERKGSKAPPTNFIANSFNSSVFIKTDMFSNNINSDNKNNIFIKYKDEELIKIDGEKQTLTYGKNITIDLKEKKIKVGSDLEWEGDIKISGNVNVTGNIKASEDITAGSISLKNHTHGYTNYPISPSGPNTSAPGTTEKPS